MMNTLFPCHVHGVFVKMTPALGCEALETVPVPSKKSLQTSTSKAKTTATKQQDGHPRIEASQALSFFVNISYVRVLRF